jgi:hypothetical protein
MLGNYSVGELSYQKREARGTFNDKSGLRKGGYSVRNRRMGSDTSGKSFAKTVWAADVVKLYMEYTRQGTPFKDIKYPPEPRIGGGIYEGRKKRGE